MLQAHAHGGAASGGYCRGWTWALGWAGEVIASELARKRVCGRVGTAGPGNRELTSKKDEQMRRFLLVLFFNDGVPGVPEEVSDFFHVCMYLFAYRFSFLLVLAGFGLMISQAVPGQIILRSRMCGEEENVVHVEETADQTWKLCFSTTLLSIEKLLDKTRPHTFF